MTTGRPTGRKGFLLLEVVLALAIFSLAATGLVVALNRTASLAQNSQSELKITRLLDSALDETISIPTLEENESSYTVPGTNIELTTKIELLEDLQNEDGQPLQEMFRIQIHARWFANGEWQERAVETWRYGRMYQP